MLNNCFKRRQKYNFRNEIASEIHDKSMPMFSSDQSPDSSRSVVYKELNTVIERALQQLPFEHRMVFSLRETSGLSIAETAEALDISEANVKVRLHRAKALLRKEIEKSYTADEIFEFNLVYCEEMARNVMSKIRSRIK